MKMNYRIKSVIVMALIVAMVAASTCMSFAGTKAYLALGADLSEDEKATVLDLLGVDDIEDYEVIYITNEEEHQYLDGHVSSSQIGTTSLSSVMVDDKIGGSISIETYNIDYCTEEMYRNALATAGVEGAKVKIAGPYTISGTAALVGAIKLYEDMSGEEISDEVIDAAVEELVTTGELNDELGDDGTVEAIIASVKEELSDNPDMSDADIEQLIRDAAAKAGISISDSQVAKIKSMLSSLKGMDINWDNVKSQSGDVLKNLKDVFDGVDIDVDTDEAVGFFDKIVNWIKSLIG